MIIAVDAAVLGVTDEKLKVGVYHFVFNLLENLSRIDKKNKYVLYSFDPISRDLMDKFDSNWINLVLRPKKGWLSLRLSTEFLVNKPDIFLGLGQAIPFYHPAKNIVFVYDLVFELYPQFYPDSYKRLARQTRFASRFASKRSDKIIAISHATKNDLVNLYKVDPEKIEVIYPGVGIKPFTPGESWLASPLQPATPGVSKPYFLFVGSYKPGKNIANIIKAFRLFRDFSTSSKNKDLQAFQLVLAGSDYWGDVGDKGDREDKGIKRLGYVKDEDLAKLYRNAAAFVSPSYYEGFGMPILEAMAAGVPVVTSDRGSIPEVTGDAAILVDPDDTGEIKDAMVKIATNGKLRTQMKKKGLIQAKKFSWEKSAEELLDIINSF